DDLSRMSSATTDVTSRIQQLSASVINKIAAGEVIERPASVVKELLENSVDALSTRIEVDIEAGGAELIRLTDDGEGIHPDDVMLAVTSHATSKIRTADDLFEVQTMGFRGEALASIAEVSKFRLRTRRAEALTGVELQVDGGATEGPKPCGCPAGTQIEVRQLFFNTPVRRKFLKTTSTEFGHISEQFTRIALANPNLHLVLRHNGRVVHELPATHQLIDRLRLFFGSELADKLIWVESDDRSLQHALGEAYRGLLMVGRYPITFLFLEVEPSQVDVNVHPTKSEVRFRDSQILYRTLLSTLRRQFLGTNLDSELSVAPEEKPEATEETRKQHQLELVNWAKRQVPGADSARTDSTGAGGDESAAGGTVERPVHPLDREERELHGDAAALLDVSPPSAGPSSGQQTAESDPGPFVLGEPANIEEGSDAGGDATAVPQTLRAMQIHDCYLVVDTGDGLTVIDQHALHERIMYERLRRRVLDGTVEVQPLLIPVTVEMTAQDAAALLDHEEVLRELGLQVESFGGTTIALRANPTLLRRADPARLLRDVADWLESRGSKLSRRDLIDHLLHMMSCKAAIKAGQRLQPEEIDALLEQRHLCDDHHHCPHGRPTALTLTRAELDRQFGRLG
ncbi:DNA mismatch repair protein MutL, partial [Durusdinium trenchii]